MSQSKSLQNLSGKWKMTSDSSDPSPVLELQGFNKLIRATASKAPITLHITQKGRSEYLIKQSTTASIPAINEEWYPEDPSYEWRENKDPFLGPVRSRAKWVKVDEVDGEGKGFLTQDLEGEVVEAEVEGLGDVGWRAKQVWCFEGERFVRRVFTTKMGEGKGEEGVETRLVYEFLGEE